MKIPFLKFCLRFFLAGLLMAGLFIFNLSKIYALDREGMDKVQERIAELARENPELAKEMRAEFKEAIGRGEIVIQREEKDLKESSDDRTQKMEQAMKELVSTQAPLP